MSGWLWVFCIALLAGDGYFGSPHYGKIMLDKLKFTKPCFSFKIQDVVIRVAFCSKKSCFMKFCENLAS